MESLSCGVGAKMSMMFLKSPRSIEVGIAWPGKRLVLPVLTTMTVIELKRHVQKYGNIPVEVQILSYKGRPLKDNKTLAYYGVKHDRTIILTRLTQNLRDSRHIRAGAGLLPPGVSPYDAKSLPAESGRYTAVPPQKAVSPGATFSPSALGRGPKFETAASINKFLDDYFGDPRAGNKESEEQQNNKHTSGPIEGVKDSNPLSPTATGDQATEQSHQTQRVEPDTGVLNGNSGPIIYSDTISFSNHGSLDAQEDLTNSKTETGDLGATQEKSSPVPSSGIAQEQHVSPKQVPSSSEPDLPQVKTAEQTTQSEPPPPEPKPAPKKAAVAQRAAFPGKMNVWKAMLEDTPRQEPQPLFAVAAAGNFVPVQQPQATQAAQPVQAAANPPAPASKDQNPRDLIAFKVKCGKRDVRLKMLPTDDIWAMKLKLEAAGVGKAGKMLLVDASGKDLDEDGTLEENGIIAGSKLIMRTIP